jgi:hypothetical protein
MILIRSRRRPNAAIPATCSLSSGDSGGRKVGWPKGVFCHGGNLLGAWTWHGRGAFNCRRPPAVNGVCRPWPHRTLRPGGGGVRRHMAARDLTAWPHRTLRPLDSAAAIPPRSPPSGEARHREEAPPRLREAASSGRPTASEAGPPRGRRINAASPSPEERTGVSYGRTRAPRFARRRPRPRAFGAPPEPLPPLPPGSCGTALVQTTLRGLRARGRGSLAGTSASELGAFYPTLPVDPDKRRKRSRLLPGTALRP